MNNKKAKALRKQAKQFALNNGVSQDTVYTSTNERSKVYRNLVGEEKYYNTCTFKLHTCVRYLYQSLKKAYKGEIKYESV